MREQAEQGVGCRAAKQLLFGCGANMVVEILVFTCLLACVAVSSGVIGYWIYRNDHQTHYLQDVAKQITGAQLYKIERGELDKPIALFFRIGTYNAQIVAIQRGDYPLWHIFLEKVPIPVDTSINMFTDNAVEMEDHEKNENIIDDTWNTQSVSLKEISERSKNLVVRSMWRPASAYSYQQNWHEDRSSTWYGYWEIFCKNLAADESVPDERATDAQKRIYRVNQTILQYLEHIESSWFPTSKLYQSMWSDDCFFAELARTDVDAAEALHFLKRCISIFDEITGETTEIILPSIDVKKREGAKPPVLLLPSAVDPAPARAESGAPIAFSSK